MRMTGLSRWTIRIPGAVPIAFSHTSAPRGMSAWASNEAGSLRLNLRARVRIGVRELEARG